MVLNDTIYSQGTMEQDSGELRREPGAVLNGINFAVEETDEARLKDQMCHVKSRPFTAYQNPNVPYLRSPVPRVAVTSVC